MSNGERGRDGRCSASYAGGTATERGGAATAPGAVAIVHASDPVPALTGGGARWTELGGGAGRGNSERAWQINQARRCWVKRSHLAKLGWRWAGGSRLGWSAEQRGQAKGCSQIGRAHV